MEELTVAGAAVNQTPLDWQGNRERILCAIEHARTAGVHVLCFPELCISGYGCEDAFHSESVPALAWENLQRIRPHTQGLVVALGLPVIHRQRLYNAVALLVNGALAGVNAKTALAGYGVHYEPRWFQAWPVGTWSQMEHGGPPIGDLEYACGPLRIAFEICEEAWAGRPSTPSSASRQADLVLNPSASPFCFEKIDTLRAIVLEASRRRQAGYVFCNLLGNEAGRLIFDGAVWIASAGKLLAEGKRFALQDHALCLARMELGPNRMERLRLNRPIPAAQPQHFGRMELLPEAAARWGFPTEGDTSSTIDVPAAAAPASPDWHIDASGVVQVPFAFPQEVLDHVAPAHTVPHSTAPHSSAPADRKDEFLLALTLGLWDYLRKSGAHGFAISLSGGSDSSTVLVLCAAMAHRALQELGTEGVLRALKQIPQLPQVLASGKSDLPRSLVRFLVRTAYQACAQSSSVSRHAAAQMAQAMGAQHVELELQPLVDAYEALAQNALGRTLSWETDDLARQNIQARVRSPSIWLLANVEQRLLLCTSNRSEAGVGYATMDGDTSGGLAPLAGVEKSFLREWLRTLETQAIAGWGPVPDLAAVNAQSPSAELRPASARQEDERDLMPYPLLDAIERAAVQGRMAPLAIWRKLLREPPAGSFSPEDLARCVERFFRLWSRSQWKRERLPVSFHLDKENIDPRSWYRFPVLNGAYACELRALSQAAGLDA